MEVAAAFRWQAEACARLGSPMYGELLHRVADAVAEGDPVVRAVLAGHEQDPGPSALALRLAGSVHRVVLRGRAPALAHHYPSTGGRWELAAAWPAWREVLRQHQAEITELLRQPPQTNEVGRAAALMGGLLHVVAATGRPVRLLEIGASAGLNLRADRFRYDHADPAGAGWGPPDSPVRLPGAWAGSPPPDVDVDVVERTGVDIAPLDPTTEEGRLTLQSYVWPDQAERLARLRGALAVARDVPAPVHRRDALSAVRALALREGTVTVLWHSVMWQYLSAEERAGVETEIAALGDRASAAAPFAHLRLEPLQRTPGEDREFLVLLRQWPEGEQRVLGRAVPHGVPVRWE
ncbi:DUF2332 domain-containing protein [Ornithinicoccus halotolerans]|uniref:DUF2332 domain-containing protein n=1 Tax=Ornithinicoccus halotolerans TaxID=1748220 RepID=UPI001296B9C4|nr:DUF2332 domain-containing protein [Ornithinicoccus halotolerans]